jgi:hypothetical protein
LAIAQRGIAWVELRLLARKSIVLAVSRSDLRSSEITERLRGKQHDRPQQLQRDATTRILGALASE